MTRILGIQNVRAKYELLFYCLILQEKGNNGKKCITGDHNSNKQQKGGFFFLCDSYDNLNYKFQNI